MKSYRGAPTNKNTRGSFKNSGQKAGAKKPVRKEKNIDHVTKRLRNISRGLFYTKDGEEMRAQKNG